MSDNSGEEMIRDNSEVDSRHDYPGMYIFFQKISICYVLGISNRNLCTNLLVTDKGTQWYR